MPFGNDKGEFQIFTDQVSEQEITRMRQMFEKNGREASLKLGLEFNLADQLDFMRKGFLMALAHLVKMALSCGIPKKIIHECLTGALEGLDHV